MITSDLQEKNINDLPEYEGTRSKVLVEDSQTIWQGVTFDPLRLEPTADNLLAIRAVPGTTPPKYEIVGLAVPPALRKEVEEAFKKNQKEAKKKVVKKTKKARKKVTFVKATKKDR